MKLKILVALIAIAFLVVSCTPTGVPTVEITNPHNEMVAGKVITLNRSVVGPIIKGNQSIDTRVMVTDNLGRVAVSQCDDLDGDGEWDEIVFVSSFEKNETLKFSFNSVPETKMPGFEKITNIRFGYKNEPFDEVESELRLKSNDSPTISKIFQMEGPAWENDVLGFRNYYDARNGIDIFGKKVKRPVLDSAGIRGQDYHKLDAWGMDILKVGNSLGAGAIALGIGDEIYRIGTAGLGTYKFICEGPVRAIFELSFNDVQAGERNYDIMHRISIYAGEHFYRSEVWVNDLMGDEVLYTGIVDMHGLPQIEIESQGIKISGTFGNQAFDGEKLGLGLLIPTSMFSHYKAAPVAGEGIIQTHLAAIKLDDRNAARYAFFAGWELQDPGFESEEYFKEMLAKAALKFDEAGWVKK